MSAPEPKPGSGPFRIDSDHLTPIVGRNHGEQPYSDIRKNSLLGSFWLTLSNATLSELRIVRLALTIEQITLIAALCYRAYFGKGYVYDQSAFDARFIDFVEGSNCLEALPVISCEGAIHSHRSGTRSLLVFFRARISAEAGLCVRVNLDGYSAVSLWKCYASILGLSGHQAS